MRQYSAQELNKIFTAIAPAGGLILPASPGLPARTSGPAVCVALRYSEIVLGAGDIESRYWDLLPQIPVVGGIGVLASINSVLSEHRAGHRDVHKLLNKRFLTADLAAKVAANEVAGPGFVSVFTRIGCLQLMRHLLLYGNRWLKPTGQSEELVGELALLTNEYLQLEAIQNPTRPETLELLLSFLPVWDVYNPRELAYALGRMFIILIDILPGKTRGAFPNEESALKLLFLAIRQASKKWTMPVQNWSEALNYFTVLWPERTPRPGRSA